MSRFYRTFAKGNLKRLADEEHDRIMSKRFKRAGGGWVVTQGNPFHSVYSGRRAARRVKMPSFRAGYNRTAGYYGRFSGAGGEKKFHDVDVDDGSIAQNGTILNGGTLNTIATGTGESARIGRKIVIRNINWRWNLHQQSAASASAMANCYRIIFYLDRQANGATAAVTDILETDNYQSFLNLANSSRFRILYDKKVVFNPNIAGNGTANDSGEMFHQGSFNKKCAIRIEYSGTDGTLGVVRSNNLGLLILGKENTTSGILDSKLRLRFTDS